MKITPPTKKILIIASIIISLFAIFIYLYSKPQQSPKNKIILTVPVAPTLDPNKKIIPLDTENPINPKQKLVFDWGILNPDLPTSLNTYRINIPLVNISSITGIANKFGFTALEKSTETDDQSYLWINPQGSLFGSITQNQIFFNSTSTLPDHQNTVSQEESIQSTKNIINNLFGESVLQTIHDPTVKYLSLQQNGEEEPANTTPDKANLIDISFRQSIDNHPLINPSKNGETISIALDTKKQLYVMCIYGGYLKLTATGQTPIISFFDLKSVAPAKAMRISSSKDIASEAIHSQAQQVNVSVKSVSLGYYQRPDNDIFPVFVIQGDTTIKGLEKFPATYIVPSSGN